jgi:hypothetical protein
MLRKLSIAMAMTAALALPSAALAAHGGGGFGGGHGIGHGFGGGFGGGRGFVGHRFGGGFGHRGFGYGYGGYGGYYFGDTACWQWDPYTGNRYWACDYY